MAKKPPRIRRTFTPQFKKFHTLKTELVYQPRYRMREEARLAIFDYIAAFYNRTRRHSSNALSLTRRPGNPVC